MSSLYSVWKNVNQIDNWTISGDSIAGIRTSFFLHDLKIQLDAGHQSFNNISVILCDHQARDLLLCVDKAFVISNCNVIASGTPSEIVKNIDAREAYFGDSFQLK